MATSKKHTMHLVVVEIATTEPMDEDDVVASVERALGRVADFANVEVNVAEDGDAPR